MGEQPGERFVDGRTSCKRCADDEYEAAVKKVSGVEHAVLVGERRVDDVFGGDKDSGGQWLCVLVTRCDVICIICD